MIYVDRKRVPIPEVLLSERANRERKWAEEFFLQERAARAQERFKFPVEILQGTRSALTQLFHGKCAYCQSSTTLASADIENFRPKSEALGLAGQSAPDHYWWLVLEWDNLYLSCQVCSQVYKRNFFPVAGPRGEYPSLGEVLNSENALLIDPCQDRPERYLRFLADGSIESRPPTEADRKRYRGHDRGQITIELLGLHREELQTARRKTLDQLLALWQSLLSPTAEPIRERSLAILRQAISPSAEYSGAARQVLAQHIQERPRPQPTWLQPLIQDLEPEREATVRKISRRGAAPSKRVPPHPATAIRGIGYIKNIQIRNFRILDDFELALHPEAMAKARSGDDLSPAEVGWKVLLGENAVGKSTVLQALALALIGQKGAERVLKDLRLDPADLLRRSNSKGSICLTLSAEPGTIEVRFDRKGLQFVRGEAGANTMVRAYGATRLLPRRGQAKLSTKLPLHGIKNLFDPYALLTNADEWLGRTDITSEEDFRDACITLKDLLAIEDDITREKGRLNVDVGSGPISLERLSSGYQASLALAIDIMRAIPNLHDKQQATGIVLVDEIDAHLHPRWKMDIVRRLRKAFPRIQFIATTHEPLCLRGLRKGEVAVVRRHEDSISVLKDLPSPEGLRVDQLLLSPFFGLDSTIDPDLDDLLKRYYRLLTLPKKALTPKQRKELKELKSKLPREGVLGYTRRDQLVYEAIDKHLAQELILKDEAKIQRLRTRTKKKIAELWRGVQARQGVEPLS